MRIISFSLIFQIVCLLLLASCSGSPGEAVSRSNATPPIFPDYKGVTVPQNIAPLNFGAKDATAIKAVFSLKGTAVAVFVGKDHLDIDEDEWHSLLYRYAGNTFQVEVSLWSEKHPEGVMYRKFPITIAPDSIDNWICYRLIDPGYQPWGVMGIFERDLSSFVEKPVAVNNENRRRCINCHSFCEYDPDRMMLHQRSVESGTFIFYNGKRRKINFKDWGIHKQAVYPKWHPSGRYILFSSNRVYQSFYDHGPKPLEVYDVSSSLFLYDVARNKQIIDDRFFGQKKLPTFGSWAPDGHAMVFCQAEGVPEEMPDGYTQIYYNILRIPFDPATAKFGERMDTLYNSSRDKGSASYPRVSPDGRYLLFTKAGNGTFPIWHPEADLKIIDLRTMRNLDVSLLNSNQADSYHAWSSNGRWILFSSRRMDGRHTRLMIAYFNRRGKACKPFMLPQRDPEDNLTRIQSYNIPEFMKREISQEVINQLKM